MRVLVTGGCGYIGSHVVLELRDAGHSVVVIDNLVTGMTDALPSDVDFILGDIRDAETIPDAFDGVEAVVHTAGLRFAGLSAEYSRAFYDVNIQGTESLLRAMQDHGIGLLVFSSSCAVYGDVHGHAVTEEQPLSPASPYGRSKLEAERLIAAWAEQGSRSTRNQATILRFFNVSGASAGSPDRFIDSLLPSVHWHGMHGEPFPIFGLDHATPDGSARRDYVHVDDIATAHHLSLAEMSAGAGGNVYNLGAGSPTSVLEVLREYEVVSGHQVQRKVAPRRAGDPSSIWADPGKASRELGWRAQSGIRDMIESSLMSWESRESAFVAARACLDELSRCKGTQQSVASPSILT